MIRKPEYLLLNEIKFEEPLVPVEDKTNGLLYLHNKVKR
jgi:hypothetical protein